MATAPLFGGGTVASVLGTTGSQRPRQRLTGQVEGPMQAPSAQMQRAPQQQQPQTFAQMQRVGMARPAPMAPPPPPMQAYGGSPQAMQARQSLQQQVQQAVASPTRYDANTYRTLESAARGNLESDFARQRSSLDEEMARRGLYDSTYAAQGYQDLGGQQARAMADLNANLLRDAAATQMSDRLAAAGLTGQFASLASDQDLAGWAANQNAAQQAFSNQMAGAQFDEGQRQFDIQQQLSQQLGLGGLGLEQQRLQQQGQQFGQNLGLEQQRLAQEGQQFGQGLGFQREQLGAQTQESAMDRLLRQQLGMGELGLGQQRLSQEGQQFGQNLGFQREQLGAQTQESALDRLLRQQLGMGELGLNQSRLAQEGQQFGQSLSEQQRQFDRSAGQTDMDRMLRQQLGLGELTGTVNGQTTVDRDRLNVDADLARQNLLGQLLGMLGLDGIRGLIGGGPGPTPPPPGGNPPPPPTNPVTPVQPQQPFEPTHQPVPNFPYDPDGNPVAPPPDGGSTRRGGPLPEQIRALLMSMGY